MPVLPGRSEPRPLLIRPEPGPATLKRVPWGGRRLMALRSRRSREGSPAGEELPIGESWEFSTLTGSESRADGRALSEVLGRSLPFLAKLIDTAAPLSIQVHPDDDPNQGTLGKEEAWIILDAEADASILAGVAEGVRERDLARAMEHAIARPEEAGVLLEVLRRIPVERGMVILVPSGTVHSIGPGILLAEIQQPTDCTHRLFDYGSDRPIHPEAARAAWRIDSQPRIWRPGEPSGALRGRHVALQIHAPGETTLGGDDPETLRLLVAVGDGVRVGDGLTTSDSGLPQPPQTVMAHGDLLLHTGGALPVRVGDGALLMSGTVQP